MKFMDCRVLSEDFRYREVYLRGRPQHQKWDDFSVRHPRMSPGRRARIFAPFDALRGFDFGPEFFFAVGPDSGDGAGGADDGSV